MIAQERRAFVRHPTALPVELSVMSIGRCRGATRDVSHGGVCLRVSASVPLGARVALTLPVLGHAWRFEAIVVWVERRGEGWDVGVAFDAVEDRARARLVEQICQIEAYRAGQVRDGRELTSEEAASEWAALHAAAFPDF